jgi:hypothetical protein
MCCIGRFWVVALYIKAVFYKSCMKVPRDLTYIFLVTSMASYFINPTLCRSLITGLVVIRYCERVFVGLNAMCSLVFLNIFAIFLICGLKYVKVTHLRSAGFLLCLFLSMYSAGQLLYHSLRVSFFCGYLFNDVTFFFYHVFSQR